MKVRVKWSPQGPVLADFMESDARIQLIMGPLGSAKTNTCIFKVLMHYACLQEPNQDGVRPTRWVVVRNTYDDLKTTSISDWREMYGPEFGTLNMGNPPTYHAKFGLPDGTSVEAEIIFRSMDRPDDIRRVRGGNYTGAWLNEIKELPKAVLDMVDGRVGRYPTPVAGGVSCSINRGEGVVLGDYNAPDEDHWLARLESERPDGYAFFRQPGGVIKVSGKWVQNDRAENIHNLPPNYYGSRIAGKSEDWIRVNLANEYGLVVDGKPVFSDYSDAVHCLAFEPDPNLPLLLGWDFGLTPACIVGQLSRRGQLRIIEEFTTENMGVRRFARDVVKPGLAKYRGFHIGLSWGDPANTRGDADEKRALGMLNDEYVDNDDGDTVTPLRMGFDTEPASTNLLTPRLEAVRVYLTMMIDGAPGFLIHPKCSKLRQALAGKYRFRRLQVVGDERFTDTPEKNEYSHCFVGETMVQTPFGQKRIDSIQPGELVETHLGPRIVTHVMSSIPDELCSVRGVICTPDHLFYTHNRGLVRADALQYSDIVLEYGKCGSTEKVITDLPTGIGAAITQRAEVICTGMSGPITTAPYQTDTTSITKTETSPTTVLKTLSAFLGKSIKVGMAHGSWPEAQKLVNLWRQLDRWLLSGIGRKKGGNGIGSTQKEWLRICRLRLESALGAVMNTMGPQDLASATSAPCPARVWQGSRPVLMMLKGSARSAGTNSKQTSTEAKNTAQKHVQAKVFPNKKRHGTRVYDLRVEGAHTFYAGGMLVSNCSDALQYLAMGAQGGYVTEKPDRYEPEFFRNDSNRVAGY